MDIEDTGVLRRFHNPAQCLGKVARLADLNLAHIQEHLIRSVPRAGQREINRRHETGAVMDNLDRDRELRTGSSALHKCRHERDCTYNRRDPKP